MVRLLLSILPLEFLDYVVFSVGCRIRIQEELTGRLCMDGNLRQHSAGSFSSEGVLGCGTGVLPSASWYRGRHRETERAPGEDCLDFQWAGRIVSRGAAGRAMGRRDLVG